VCQTAINRSFKRLVSLDSQSPMRCPCQCFPCNGTLHSTPPNHAHQVCSPTKWSGSTPPSTSSPPSAPSTCMVYRQARQATAGKVDAIQHSAE
jgi:hypothetical protein